MADPLSFIATVQTHGRTREVKDRIPDPHNEVGWIDIEHDVHAFALHTDPDSPIRAAVTVHIPEGAAVELDYRGRYRVTIERED